MPPCFSSYYEIWDKTLSSGASSSIGRERTRINNIGALHLQIEHQFIQPTDGSKSLIMSSIPVVATNLIKEEQLMVETKRHLRFSRERKEKQKKNKEIKERLDQYSESDKDDLMQPLALEVDMTDDEEFGEMVSAPFNENLDEEYDNESLEDSLSQMNGKDQVIKMIGKLLAAFVNRIKSLNIKKKVIHSTKGTGIRIDTHASSNRPFSTRKVF